MRKILFLLLILSVITMTACGSQGNVSNRAYVRTAAIDGNTLTLAFFSGEETVSVSADDLEKAKSKVEVEIGKEVFAGHTELILLSDCDSRGVLEYIFRQWKPSPSCMVLKINENGGEAIRNRDPEELSGAVRVAVEQGKLPECDIINVLSEN